LKLIKSAIKKKGITNGEDLHKLAKKLFGKRFIGIYVVKSINDVPTLKEGQIAVLNTNEHWYFALRKHGKLYESDSYGIDELGPKYIDIKPPKNFIQGNRGIDNMDCGQRAITNMIFDA
jgi:hypothetical protein